LKESYSHKNVDFDSGHVPSETNASIIRINDWLELCKDWNPTLSVGIDKLIEDAEIIGGLPFVKLSYLIESKRLRLRLKAFP